MKAIVTIILATSAFGAFAAEIPKAPIPPSPYLPIIYKFADAMLERGRDTNGLFHSALDRATFSPLTNRPVSQKSSDHHQNLLRLLYTLSELSTKPKYRDAADIELRWFLENTDKQKSVFARPWMLWDRCFALSPDASRRLAFTGSWQNSLNHPDVVTAYPGNLARDSGFFIRNCAVVYERMTNELVLTAAETLLARLGENIDPATGLMTLANPSSLAAMLSLVIDCDAASRFVPKPLSERLTSFAALQDTVFSNYSHDPKGNRGFLLTADFRTGKAGKRTSELWKAQHDSATTAQIAMMCVSRYENTGNVTYRELFHAAADAYLNSLPPADVDAWPMTFGHAISLQVAAWRSTAQQRYLDRAREFADFAVKHFFDQGPLPRASLKSNHYEAITGADTLALGLVELHLHILGITAVRCPPNTIDR